MGTINYSVWTDFSRDGEVSSWMRLCTHVNALQPEAGGKGIFDLAIVGDVRE